MEFLCSRVAYEPDAPKIVESETSETEAGYVSQHQEAGGSLHVLFELGDHLGSTSVVLDKATGELVERATFQAYGGSESDYRPERWNAFREDYRFTGKEEDVEVGLQYFGKRYLNAQLGRWISADPLAVHAPGEADANLYAYVRGRALKTIDPVGLAEPDAGSDQSADCQGRCHDPAPASTNGADADAMFEFFDELDEREARRKSWEEANESIVAETEKADQQARAAEGRPARDAYGVECSGDFHDESAVQAAAAEYPSEEDRPVDGSLAPLFATGMFVVGTELLTAGFAPSLELQLARWGSRDTAYATETFYRTMSPENVLELQLHGRIPATGETFMSPSAAYASEYNGILVELQFAPGTTERLAAMGVRDQSKAMRLQYPELPQVTELSGTWTAENAFFKFERGTPNIGLGSGEALTTANDNLLLYNVLSF